MIQMPLWPRRALCVLCVPSIEKPVLTVSPPLYFAVSVWLPSGRVLRNEAFSQISVLPEAEV